jgi:phosphoglycolate phosphatase-like HAD superfamily hydrolase
MIGDRSHDIIGAKNNRMGAIGVLYGYGGREELIGAGASHVCATPARCSTTSAGASVDELELGVKYRTAR